MITLSVSREKWEEAIEAARWQISQQQKSEDALRTALWKLGIEIEVEK